MRERTRSIVPVREHNHRETPDDNLPQQIIHPGPLGIAINPSPILEPIKPR
jgi:hypothetical protein